ncbi:sugar phosphate isomerase/epimerase [Opitutia bacterium ISCC 51]|nr:sugar phosphate isomerase/epimerase [Opitutae bacterium ISCC 51]QXD29849.1 sugar phosphate isomerase/epimerase [Opitutae bacterium ISCC 52]
MKVSRRVFLQKSTLASAFLAGGATLPLSLSGGEAFIRPGQPRFKLSLAAYSFRKQFSWFKGNPQSPADASKPMDMFKFIDFCADHNCDGAELTSYFFPVDADLAYYNQLKHHAYVRGVTIHGTAIGNDFSLPKGIKLDYQIEAAKAGLDQAAALGAGHVRFFAGTGKGFSQGRDRINNAVESLKVCCDYAGERGVFVGVENHGDITPDLLLEIIEKVDSPWIGINLDTGNFFSDTPYIDLERCALHTVNVQVKVNMQTPAPERKRYPADFDRIADILKRANYQGYVVLEFEEDDAFKEIPPYLKKLDSALDS